MEWDMRDKILNSGAPCVHTPLPIRTMIYFYCQHSPAMVYWMIVSKTVRPMHRCLSVLFVCRSCPVCDVAALWPNGWMDLDAT